MILVYAITVQSTSMKSHSLKYNAYPLKEVFLFFRGLATVQQIKCLSIVWQAQYVHQRIDGKIKVEYSRECLTDYSSNFIISEQLFNHMMIVVKRCGQNANDGNTRYENNSP